MGDKPGVLQAQTWGRGVLLVETCHDLTVTVPPSHWSQLHKTGLSLAGCEWTKNNLTSTAVKPTTTPQQSQNNVSDFISLLQFYSFSPDNCWGDHKAPWPRLGPPATKFSRLMDANTDGSGLARNQLFQNQNIHYQQTTGSGVGAHLVQRTKAWRQKITFMLFTGHPSTFFSLLL